MEELFDPLSDAFEAKMAQRRKRLRVVYLVATLIIVALASWLFTQYEPSDTRVLPLSIKLAQAHKAAPDNINPNAQTISRGVAKANLDSVVINLKRLDNHTGISQWHRETQKGFRFAQDTALSAWRNGQYDASNSIALALSQDIPKFIQNWQTQAQSALAQGYLAFANRQVELGNQAATKLANLGLNDPEMNALHQQLKSLSVIVNLEKNIALAQAQGDEQAVGEQLLRLSELLPNDVQVMTKQFHYEQTQLSQQIEYWLEAAQTRIQNKDFLGLHTAIQEIRALDQVHPSLERLRYSLADFESLFSANMLAQQIQLAVSYDDWETVQRYVEQGGDAYPNHPKIQSYAQDTTQILRLKERFSTFLNTPPTSLTSSILHSIETQLQMASVYLPSSASLRSLHDDVRAWVDSATGIFAVTIISDGNSHVVLRAPDEDKKLGQFTQSKVNLAPGQYQFEVHRIGYQSRLVNLSVNSEPTTVHLSAEQILL